jgi:1-phosphofructokinase
MIVTVTPNPSVDRTFEIEQLVRGQVVRALSHRLDPGGKGINVARALQAHGHRVSAVVPVGGVEGDQLIHLLGGSGLAVVTVPISGTVRSNVTVVEPDGTVTKLNEPGPTLTADEVDALLRTGAAAATGARWLVASGSLPPDAPDDLLAQLARRGRDAGAAVAVDTSGAALNAALRAGPDLVKPNADELAELTGCPLVTVGDAVDAARDVLALGARAVLASLGSDGAVLVTPELSAHAESGIDAPRSSVGAGDAALAGYISATGDPVAALRAAVAWGAAAVRLPGSQMPAPDDVHPDAVRVYDPPRRDRPLSAPAVPLDGVVTP